MKRTIITLLLVAASAFALMSTNAMAHDNRGPGGYGMRGGHGMMGGGYGMMGGGYGVMGRGCGAINGGYNMMNYQGDVDDSAYQVFQKETAELRSSLRADMVELDAVMAAANPDAQKARALSESISAKQNQLAEAARKNNIQSFGNGWNCNGSGWYCNRW